MDYKPKQLKFEDYLSFIHDQDANKLTYNQLNQILFLHGFVKLTSHTKEEAMHAISLLDLVMPTRSTISTRIYCPIAPLSLVEVQLDRREMNWEECPTGSVMSFKPMDYCSVSDSSSLLSGVVSVLPGICTKKVKQMKVKELKKIYDSNANLVVKPLPVKTTMRVPVSRLKVHDVYSWRGNGTKKKDNAAYKWYYRCGMKSCPVRKTVFKDPDDLSMCIVNYVGEHNHGSP